MSIYEKEYGAAMDAWLASGAGNGLTTAQVCESLAVRPIRSHERWIESMMRGRGAYKDIVLTDDGAREVWRVDRVNI